MKTYYTFEESGQKLTDDQTDQAMLNQIRKMTIFDIPREELDQIKQDIREDLKELGFKIKEWLLPDGINLCVQSNPFYLHKISSPHKVEHNIRITVLFIILIPYF